MKTKIIDDKLYELIEVNFDCISNREHFEFGFRQFVDDYKNLLSREEFDEFISAVLEQK